MSGYSVNMTRDVTSARKTWVVLEHCLHDFKNNENDCFINHQLCTRFFLFIKTRQLKFSLF